METTGKKIVLKIVNDREEDPRRKLLSPLAKTGKKTRGRNETDP